jgi:NAD+ kinase
MPDNTKIGVVASHAKEAKEALKRIVERYGFTELDVDNPDANGVESIVVLGGDGFMLHAMHSFMDSNTPLYGMNRGSVGFLMNAYDEDNLIKNVKRARSTQIHPLRMVAHNKNKETEIRWAFNEVSILRNTGQAAHIRISVDDVVHMEQMICDGVLVATPAGSSAYNVSIGGPIIPIRTEILALTPISPFRPRRWKGALLPDKVKIAFDILDSTKRPVHAVADFQQVKNVVKIEVEKDLSHEIALLFDAGHSLEERLLREQFTS